MIAAERETTVTSTDADDVVRIWTAQLRFIGQLRRHPSFTEVKSGRYDGSPWAEFTIPASLWSPATGAKRRSGMSEEQKAAAAARLRALRGSPSPKIPDGASRQRSELADPLPA